MQLFTYTPTLHQLLKGYVDRIHNCDSWDQLVTIRIEIDDILWEGDEGRIAHALLQGELDVRFDFLSEFEL